MKSDIKLLNIKIHIKIGNSSTFLESDQSIALEEVDPKFLHGLDISVIETVVEILRQKYNDQSRSQRKERI